jgi:hypothetical protein
LFDFGKENKIEATTKQGQRQQQIPFGDDKQEEQRQLQQHSDYGSLLFLAG